MEKKPTIWTSLEKHITAALTLRYLSIRFNPQKCSGMWQCYEVCPVGCWTPDKATRKVQYHDPEKCIACGACVLQCPEDAIELRS